MKNRVSADTIWVLFDISNGDTASCQYVWWFKTRKLARAHKRRQHANPNNARLVGPYKYKREE